VLGTGAFESHVEAAGQAARLQGNGPRPVARRDLAQPRWRLWISTLLELWGPAACIAGASLLDDVHQPRRTVLASAG
jgi:hypothetical protein